MIQKKEAPLWLGGFEAVAILASIASGVFTLRSVLDLTYGKLSYDHVADYWRAFLFG